MISFEEKRRQNFIDEETYRNTLAHFQGDETIYAERLAEPRTQPGSHATTLRFRASALWDAFQLRYTAGEDLVELSRSLEEVVNAFESYVGENEEKSDDDYVPPFLLDDMIDTYVDYVNLLSAAILLHREDLIPRIYGLIEGGDYDGGDAVIEELLKFYLPDRPALDEWLWDKPYRLLLDALDAESAKERESFMAKYVQSWYKSMKGRANFWGAHETIEPSFSPYFGYWAMCAAAVTYLYGIDDQKYRSEIVYPKDLVDFARSMPRRVVALDDGTKLLRVVGGQPCPKDGIWFSPAKMDSMRDFKAGEIMPSFDASEYGATIWQWVPGSQKP
jgi:hypothetical protein